jgi:DNA adenine methylase
MSEPNNDLFSLFQVLDQGTNVREQYVRAPFGWPGSKWRSLDHILPELPYRQRYCEPFGGSGKVLLARNACDFEVLNDRYAGVTCFYRVLKDAEKLNLLIARLEDHCYSREEFIWCRDTWKTCSDDIERAARWYYTIKCSFGSQGRNFGRSLDSAMMPKAYHNNIKLFPKCSQRLRHVYIENLDWRQCLRDYDHPEMVWYLDPPYYKVTKGMFEIEMPNEDHIEMLDRIQHLKGFVAVSSYPNDVYNKYAWDKMVRWTVRTSTLGYAYTDENHLNDFKNVLLRKDAEECLYIREN